MATVATGLMSGGTVLWELREGMLGCVNAWLTPKDGAGMMNGLEFILNSI